jgi:hypothetical protein
MAVYFQMARFFDFAHVLDACRCPGQGCGNDPQYRVYRGSFAFHEWAYCQRGCADSSPPASIIANSPSRTLDCRREFTVSLGTSKLVPASAIPGQSDHAAFLKTFRLLRSLNTNDHIEDR